MTNAETYPRYTFTGQPGTDVNDLGKHLALYDILGAYYTCNLYSDGSKGAYVFRSFGLGQYGPLGVILSAVLNTLTYCAAVACNGIQSLVRWRNNREHRGLRGVAKVTSVEGNVLLQVSPLRARWCELVLCKWAVRKHLHIEPVTGQTWVHHNNLLVAERHPEPPTPWKLVKGYSTGRVPSK